MLGMIVVPDIDAADLNHFGRLLPSLNYEWLRENWIGHYREGELRWVRVDPVGFEVFLGTKLLPRSLSSLLRYAEFLAN